jgi:hypothetical protein
MNEVGVRRATGVFGVMVGVISVIELPLYFWYSGAPPASNVLTRILLDLFVLAFLIVFLGGFRHLILRADPEYEWIGTLAFGTGLVYVAITFAANSLEAGAVLGATDSPIDPTSTTEGLFLMYGSIGRLLTAVFLVASGFAIRCTEVLPRWTGGTAYALALIHLAFVPSIYFGADPAQFYSAVGWGTTALVGSLFTYWVLAVGIVMIAKGRRIRSGIPSGRRWAEPFGRSEGTESRGAGSVTG